MGTLLFLAISVVLTAGLALALTLFIRIRAVQPHYDPQKSPPPISTRPAEPPDPLTVADVTDRAGSEATEEQASADGEEAGHRGKRA